MSTVDSDHRDGLEAGRDFKSNSTRKPWVLGLLGLALLVLAVVAFALTRETSVAATTPLEKAHAACAGDLPDEVAFTVKSGGHAVGLSANLTDHAEVFSAALTCVSMELDPSGGSNTELITTTARAMTTSEPVVGSDGTYQWWMRRDSASSTLTVIVGDDQYVPPVDP